MDAPLPDNLVTAWEQFFAANPLDYSTAIFNDGTLFPLQRKNEMVEMLRVASTINPKTIMEIGADKAGSLFHWMMLPTVRNIIACEIRGTPYDALFRAKAPHLDFLCLPQSSYSPETVDQVRIWLDLRDKAAIDVLFIDGDKSMFETDFYTYLPLLSKKSIVFFHDIQDRAPGMAFERVSAHYPSDRVVNTDESAIACEKERAGIPCSSAHESWLRHWRGRSCGVGVIYVNK